MASVRLPLLGPFRIRHLWRLPFLRLPFWPAFACPFCWTRTNGTIRIVSSISPSSPFWRCQWPVWLLQHSNRHQFQRLLCSHSMWLLWRRQHFRCHFQRLRRSFRRLLVWQPVHRQPHHFQLPRLLPIVHLFLLHCLLHFRHHLFPPLFHQPIATNTHNLSNHILFASVILNSFHLHRLPCDLHHRSIVAWVGHHLRFCPMFQCLRQRHLPPCSPPLWCPPIACSEPFPFCLILI